MDAVLGGAEEGALNVGAEGLGAVFGGLEATVWSEEGEDLHPVRTPILMTLKDNPGWSQYP